NVILKPFGKQKGLAAIQAGTMIHALQTPSQANCSKNTIEFLHRLGHGCDHPSYVNLTLATEEFPVNEVGAKMRTNPFI
ncbi:MAG TPA: hypothetical protein VIK59_04190, partial [Verrucomicrobiae bacterium]